MSRRLVTSWVAQPEQELTRSDKVQITMINQKDHDDKRHDDEVPARHARAGIREEEVCQIFNLKKNLDYSDVLIKYAGKYIKLGWDLVAVNAQAETTLDLDFNQPEEVWSPKLTTMGIEGLQINLGVRTGKPSRLLVLEVHRDESLAPFNRRGDCGSGCVAEVGNDREQHYYMVPRGWQPPPSYFLESFQIMVFGEEGMVLAPPSMEPAAQTSMRWLRPPWENPPTRPSPALCKFIKESSPSLVEGTPPPVAPQVPTWSEIYPRINRYPAVLQALVAPAAKPEEYYQTLVAAAREAGLEDSQLILGLLWHAPMGETAHISQRWEYFQRLVRGDHDEDQERHLPEPRRPRTKSILTPRGTMGSPPRPRSGPGQEPKNGEANPEDAVPGPAPETPAVAPGHELRRDEGPRPNGNGRPRRPEGGEHFDSWSELFRLSRDNLVVDRQRYEAMIYELGKLGAWQEFFKGHQRETRSLREKIEAQWTRELEFFRQLNAKNDKKGWRKW
jgi:hypothetical protein